MDKLSGPARRAGGARRLARTVVTAAALAACATAAPAAPLRYVETVMSGLANPRGLTFGPDGALYVAEAGSGGDGPAIVTGDGSTLGYGTTGAITRLQGGAVSSVVVDLPSFAPESGEEANGIQDLAFGPDGRIYATMGLGANPAELANVAGQTNAYLAGTLAGFDVGTGAAEVIADIPMFEALNNPDGNNPDTNVYGVAPVGGGFRISDAGANAVFSVDAAGDIATEAVLPNLPNPGFGPPTYQAVPTGAALGPGGEFVFGQLTGFPFNEGAAQIFSLSGGTLSVLASGLTNIIDVGYSPDGVLHALELDSDGLVFGPNTTGALYAIAPDGSRTLRFGDFERPTGFAFGDDGSVYVSVNGFSGTDGSVIRLEPVPLPATLPALAGALGLLAWRARRRAT